MNKPFYKWYESWWIIIVFFLLAPATYGLTLFLSGVSALIRANTLHKQNKLMKNNAVIRATAPPISKQIHENIPKANEFRSSNTHDYLSYSKIRKLESDYTVIDFETTGLDPDESEIIQLAAVKYRNHKKVDEYWTFIHTFEDIPARITKINGITNEDVENAPYIQNELPKLINFIGEDVIIAHNASFDMKFLLTNIYETKMEYKKFRVIDTLSLARKHITNTDNHKLVTLKRFLKLDHYKSHDALYDCYVAAEVYKYCYENSRE